MDDFKVRDYPSYLSVSGPFARDGLVSWAKGGVAGNRPSGLANTQSELIVCLFVVGVSHTRPFQAAAVS